MKTKLFLTGLVFMALTAIVSAQSTEKTTRPLNNNGRGMAYVDANNDGICDNYTGPKGSANAAGRNGACMGCGQRNGQMKRSGCGQGMAARGTGMGMNRGQQRNMNFTDANKNGICDNREVAAKK